MPLWVGGAHGRPRLRAPAGADRPAPGRRQGQRPAAGARPRHRRRPPPHVLATCPTSCARATWSWSTTPGCCRCGCARAGPPAARPRCCCWSRAGDGAWEALVRPYRRLRDGERLAARRRWRSVVLERLGDGPGARPAGAAGLAGGGAAVGRRDAAAALHHRAARPIPARYQTVYARQPGSAAAPTAGLHFTRAAAGRAARTPRVVAVTLDVGLDTFRPVAEERARPATACTPSATGVRRGGRRRRSRGALDAGRRVVAVGTTTVRVLETVFGEHAAAAARAAPAC